MEIQLYLDRFFFNIYFPHNFFNHKNKLNFNGQQTEEKKVEGVRGKVEWIGIHKMIITHILMEIVL